MSDPGFCSSFGGCFRLCLPGWRMKSSRVASECEGSLVNLVPRVRSRRRSALLLSETAGFINAVGFYDNVLLKMVSSGKNASCILNLD